MRALTFVLLSVAACYSPAYRDCEVTCAGGSCPSGFTCDNGVCRTEGFTTACGGGSGMDASNGADASWLGDPDNDGVQYPGDNCPTKANPDQFDEDRDLIGDDCDPCPVFGTAADNKDSDDDGVGDGCDPSPITPGNSILVFDGFNKTMLVANGTVIPAADWQIGNGLAVASAANSSLTSIHTISWQLPAGTTAETVLAHLNLKSIGPNRPLGVGVVTQWSPPGQTGIACWNGFETTTNNGILKLFNLNPNAQPPLGLANDPFVPGNPYSPDMTRRGTEVSCSEKNAVSPLNSSTNVTGANAGAVVVGVDATFDWILIVAGR